MRGPSSDRRFSEELRRYVQQEWNGNGSAVLTEIARAVRDTTAPRRGPAIRAFFARLVDGIAGLMAAPVPGGD